MAQEPEIYEDSCERWIALEDPGPNLGQVVTLLRVHCGLPIADAQRALKEPDHPFFKDHVRAIKELEGMFWEIGATIKPVPDPE